MSKLTVFISLLFVFNLAIYLFTGYDLNLNKVSVEQRNPQIILRDFKLLEIDKNGSVKTTLSGTRGLSYKDGIYKIKSITLLSVNFATIETVSGDYAFYREKSLDISGNVKYSRSDGSELETNRLSYHVKDNMFHIPNDFIFKMSNTIVRGNSLYIMRNTGIINAENIQATLTR